MAATKSSETQVCISNAEVAILLQNHVETSKRKVAPYVEETLKYAKRFSGMEDPSKNMKMIDDLRMTLQNESATENKDGEIIRHKLSSKEIVALMNLAPRTIEDAHILIPSLRGVFEGEDLERILGHLDVITM